MSEQRKKVVFCGKTGDEVNRHYLPLAGLRRSGVRFTNAIRCLPVSAGGKLDPGRAKDVALLESCAQRFLFPEIERGAYRCLIPLGAFAAKALCPGVSLDLDHGMPQETDWGLPAFPMFHPALGIHEPKKMLHIRTDWQRLRAYLGGRLVLPQDDYPDPDYREVTDVRELSELVPTLPLASDTESTRQGEPYCLTYSQQPGTGRLIRANRVDLIYEFGRRVAEWRAPLLWHNWLYDWAVATRLGLSYPHRRVVDTMAVVFHLGNLPQGLKALASRELGMKMQDFEDVVAPHSRERVLHYYELAALQEWPKPEEELVRTEGGTWKLYRPQSLATKLKRFHSDLEKHPDKDVFGAWDNWEGHRAELEQACGPYPGRCISHVPFEQMLYYSCRDADALIRLWPVLQRMRANVRHTSQEHWRKTA